MSEQMKKDGRSNIHENSKNRDLELYREASQEQYLTTNQGVRVNHTDDSLKAGSRGPTLMEDFHFREKMTHFDHERIPERVVHARGSGAHGFFQVYQSMAKYTRAKFLQDPNKKTPVFVRFSTVVGFRGSADTVRDARGFATKFYTEEGVYDLVANNIPVFFIQDAIKFPDVVHAIKPEPHHEMPQASAAHDNFWDFISLMPESMNMIMWLMSDRAIPRSLRMMEGFGVNTFRFMNDQGKAHFVKFHWKPVLGVHSLVWDEAQKIAGKDPDFHRRDLWDAIEMGNYPEFELGVQMIEENDEFKFDFDVLDATKIWPEELVPVMKVGKLVLNRNPDNFFAETEQVAFHPGNVLPGIDFSNDPLLQGRLFSYLDTQLIRLGGPNFHELPINRSVAPVHNNQQDGFMRQTIKTGRVNYFPNSLGNGCPMLAPESMGGYVHHAEKVDGHKIRERSESFQDHFSQATMFWNSMSEAEKMHIVDAFRFELGKVMTKDVRMRMVEMIARVDNDLARQVAEGIGVQVFLNGRAGVDSKQDQAEHRDRSRLSVDRSPSVSMENTPKDTIRSRKVAVLVSEGYNHTELEQVKKALEGAGANVEIVSRFQGRLQSMHNAAVEVDHNYLTTASVVYDAIFVPGGQQSVEKLKMHGEAIQFVNEAFRHCKPVGASGEGVDLLLEADIAGVKLAGPKSRGELVTEDGVVTVRGARSMDDFNAEFVRAIMEHRHWNRELRKKVPV